MGTATGAVQELFESGHTPGKVCTLLRGCVGQSGVYKALKHLKETCAARPKVGSTPGCKFRVPKLIENSGKKVGRNPGRSIKLLDSAAGVNCGAMQNVLRGELSLSSFAKIEAQLLSWDARVKGLHRAGLLFEGLKDGTQPLVLLTDERLFTVQAVHGHQSGRIYAANEQSVSLNGRLVFRGQSLAFVLVWAGVASAGEMAPSSLLEIIGGESARVFGAVAGGFGALGKLFVLGRRNYPTAGRSHPPGATNLVQEWFKSNMAGFWPKKLSLLSLQI